jgi:CRP-like cAMP-binding protein
LERPNKPIDQIAFVETGIISVASVLPAARHVEIGMIGCEGMTGTAVVLGDDRSVHSTHVRMPGTALRISAGELRIALSKSRSMQGLLLKYVNRLSYRRPIPQLPMREPSFRHGSLVGC